MEPVDFMALLVQTVFDEVGTKTTVNCVVVFDSVILEVWSISDVVGPITAVVDLTMVLNSVKLASPSIIIIHTRGTLYIHILKYTSTV